jgi:hypothetical protein
MFIKIPTELNDKQIQEFQQIYKKVYGEEISREEAINQGLSIIRLLAISLTNTGHNK